MAGATLERAQHRRGVGGAVGEPERHERPQAAAVPAMVDREHAIAGLGEIAVGAEPVEVGGRDPAVQQHHRRAPSPPVSRRNISPRPGTCTVRAGGSSIGGSGGHGGDGCASRAIATRGRRGFLPSAPMAVVIASDLGKDIAGEPLLRGISFKLERRDRMTLSGRNGAGKTTLLRMLAGEASIDGGELVLAKGAKVALHDQRPPRERGLTLRDYILSGAPRAGRDRAGARDARAGDGGRRPRRARRWTATPRRRRGSSTPAATRWRDRALATLHGLGFRDDADLDRSLRHVLRRRADARVARPRARRATRTCCCSTSRPTTSTSSRSSGSSSTSSRSTRRSCWSPTTAGSSRRSAPRCSSSRPAAGKFFAGPWHAWRKEKAARELALGRAIERQQAEIERLERFVTRFRAGTRARQAQSRAKKLDEDRADLPRRRRRRRARVRVQAAGAQRPGRVRAARARCRVGEQLLLDDAELWLERGEHVSLVGPNGAGKTTLIETLAGPRASCAQGKLRTGHNVKVGYLSQHAEELAAGTARTVLEAASTRPG